MLRVIPAGTHDVKRNTLRRFLSDAWQPFELVNQPCQRLREIAHAGLKHARRQAETAQHTAHLPLGFVVHLLHGIIAGRQYQIL